MSEQEFWMVWKEGSGIPFKKHPSLKSAEDEAERLTKCNEGTFYVLHAVSCVKRVNVVWNRDLDETVPIW